MKVFEAPVVEVVFFGNIDIVTASCVPCEGCEEGSYHCGNYDFGKSVNAAKPELGGADLDAEEAF